MPLEQSEEDSIIDLVRRYGSVSRVFTLNHKFPFKALIEPQDSFSYASILTHLKQLDHSLGQLKVYPSKKRDFDSLPFPECSELRTKTYSMGANFTDEKPSEFTIGNESRMSNFQTRYSKQSFASQSTLTNSKFSQEPVSLVSSISLPLSNIVSKYVKVIYSYPNNLNLKFLAKLFGSFGNLERILYDSTSSRMFAEFETTIQAKSAVSLLDGLTFFSNSLIMTLVTEEDFEAEIALLKTFKEDLKNYRFRPNLKIRMNPVSSVLHFTNLPQILDPVIFFTLICQINEPVKIVRSLYGGAKNYFMYLVYFESKEAAAEVLSVMHNKTIEDKAIKVSFSHPTK
jgi:hypothetical protein